MVISSDASVGSGTFLTLLVAAVPDFLARINVGLSLSAAGFVGSFGFGPGEHLVVASFRKWLLVTDLLVIATEFVPGLDVDLAAVVDDDRGGVFPNDDLVLLVFTGENEVSARAASVAL